MNNCEGNITAQARELKLKAEVKELKNQLAKMENMVDTLVSENDELTAKNNFLKGQVEAYERVLSHMIYNDSSVEDSPCINCEGECEMCGEG